MDILFNVIGVLLLAYLVHRAARVVGPAGRPRDGAPRDGDAGDDPNTTNRRTA